MRNELLAKLMQAGLRAEVLYDIIQGYSIGGEACSLKRTKKN